MPGFRPGGHRADAWIQCSEDRYLAGRGFFRLTWKLLQRPDIRRSPVKALWRRLAWRARWRLCREPWLLSYRGNIRIAVPRDGLGAQLFYDGVSEPDIEEFCLRFLQPGMIVFDVGAHVGKYTLLCARAVGPQGHVHAFEPNPALFHLLQLNIARNHFNNSHARQCAVSDEDGVSDFELCAESSISSLVRDENRDSPRGASKILRVPTLRLDSFCAQAGLRPRLVKVDVEGAELLVFQGATNLLDLPAGKSPVWIFEHEPANYARFGYAPARLFALLRRHGYRTWTCRDGRVTRLEETAGIPVNLVAAKEESWGL
jgi:FkbM family methyltransferase